MSDDRTRFPEPTPPSSNEQRRRSIVFADFISKPVTKGVGSVKHSPFPPSTATSAQPSQQRRLSITTLGLSGSPTQTSPFGTRAFRRASMSSSVEPNSRNAEESAVEETESASPPTASSSPFARRFSFGTQALRDSQGGSMSNGRYPPPPTSSIPGLRRSVSTTGASSVYNPTGSAPASLNRTFLQREKANVNYRHTGEGFYWAETLRSRAERAPSAVAVSPSAPNAGTVQGYRYQGSASVSPSDTSPKEIPKRGKQNKPDFFQEKILRGDFMD